MAFYRARVSYEAPQDPFVTSSQLQVARRRPRLWLVALLAAFLAVALIAAGVLIPKAFKNLDAKGVATNPAADISFAPQPFSVKGFLTLKLGQFAWYSTDDTCYGYQRYEDIRSGTQVVITDPAGKTVAMGHLEAGIPRHDPNDTNRVTECRFPIKVAGVPGEHAFYGIEISNRGKLDFPRDRMAGSLELTLK